MPSLGQFLLFFSVLSSAAPPNDATTLFRRASKSVVVIVVALPDGTTSQGSGVVIGPGRIVTNKHVIGSVNDNILVKQDERIWRAVVFKRGATDLAILDVLMTAARPFDLPSAPRRPVRSVQVGERVYAIG